MSVEPVDDDTIYVERPGGFEQIPDAVWLEGACSPQATVMYLALSKRGSKEARGVPKRRTLGKDMGVSSVRTVDARIDELVEKGWLLVTPRFRPDGDKQQTSNHYRLMWEPITSPDDPRLLRHQRETAAFEAEMAARQAANKAKEEEAEKVRSGDTETLTDGQRAEVKARSVRAAAWAPPAQNVARGAPRKDLHGGGAESCTGPVQEVAPQEPDLLGTTQGSTTPVAAQLASNQESFLEDGETSAPPLTPQTTSKAKRKSRLDPAWWPSEQLQSWAANEVVQGGVTVALHTETEQFKDHHIARGNTMVDWDRAFQTWVRNAVVFAKREAIRNQGRRGPGTNHQGQAPERRHDAEAEWAEALG